MDVEIFNQKYGNVWFDLRVNILTYFLSLIILGMIIVFTVE